MDTAIVMAVILPPDILMVYIGYRYTHILNMNEIHVVISRNHLFLSFFFFFFFLSPDFHELWHSMSISLFTEVKRQWATFVLNPFQHCLLPTITGNLIPTMITFDIIMLPYRHLYET